MNVSIRGMPRLPPVRAVPERGTPLRLPSVGSVCVQCLSSSCAHLRARRPPPILTPRQIEVVRLVAECRSNKEIAFALGRAPGTVKAHLRSVGRKLGFAGQGARTRMALWAQEHAELLLPAAEETPEDAPMPTAA